MKPSHLSFSTPANVVRRGPRFAKVGHPDSANTHLTRSKCRSLGFARDDKRKGSEMRRGRFGMRRQIRDDRRRIKDGKRYAGMARRDSPAAGQMGDAGRRGIP
uniref:Uncharacterized protein n=1 Tax=Paracidobacterium acidisoli TaxID=2303751 RepID=A0A372IRQ4_9BACT